MNTFLLYFGEWHWIFLMSLAVLMSFSWWRFPDLTVESSFCAGMVCTYIAMKMSGGSIAHLLIAVLLLGIASTVAFSFATWALAAIDFPPLFAGLVVMLAAYSANFYLNGSVDVQMLDMHHIFPTTSPEATPAGDRAAVFSFMLAVAIGALLVWFSRTRSYEVLTLVRRIPDQHVARTFGLRKEVALLLAMLIYNLVSFVGGVGEALYTSQSSVTFTGAVSPGILCTFITRQIRLWASTTAYRSSQSAIPKSESTTSRILHWFIRQSDELWLSVSIIALLSAVASAVRHFIHSSETPGMMNAYTALGTFVGYLVCAGVAKVVGKQVKLGIEE
ncbi:MAG: hypothetical protein U0941_20865 [Planctomycetaceae bacterium]